MDIFRDLKKTHNYIQRMIMKILKSKYSEARKMGTKPICSAQESEEIKADFADIKKTVKNIACSIDYLKNLLVRFLQVEYAYQVLDFETNKEMVDEIAKCYKKNPTTIYNIINEVKVLIELGLDPGEISQAALLVLKGSMKKSDWKAVFNVALELSGRDVSKLTTDVMKQAVHNFKGELEEEEIEPPATRGRQTVTPLKLGKKAKYDGRKDSIKPSDAKAKLTDKVAQLKFYLSEMQGYVKEMEYELLD
ncbi:hypothetical protein IVG45_19155 [Methylomonas sp. LL1]|uniref:hypothetical protein n=1 Tax=Methylomonas sp. LL1 TaxID=2785785 RepID=UPI0018C39C99|nr:hypothetical protein [Methylomonas sp. LL1]QPK62921.1 hypothetical protein IVG45_19155 [Methylomonas sp. LL1]